MVVERILSAKHRQQLLTELFSFAAVCRLSSILFGSVWIQYSVLNQGSRGSGWTGLAASELEKTTCTSICIAPEMGNKSGNTMLFLCNSNGHSPVLLVFSYSFV